LKSSYGFTLFVWTFCLSNCLLVFSYRSLRLVKNYLFNRSCGHTCKIIGFQFVIVSDGMYELIKRYDIALYFLIRLPKHIWRQSFAFGVQEDLLDGVLSWCVVFMLCCYASDRKLIYWIIGCKMKVLSRCNWRAKPSQRYTAFNVFKKMVSILLGLMWKRLYHLAKFSLAISAEEKIEEGFPYLKEYYLILLLLAASPLIGQR